MQIDIIVETAYSKWYVRVYVYVTRHRPINSGRYATGQKRCQICEIFIKWDGLWCPCCGCRLRIGPRLFKDKAKLRIKQQEQPSYVLLNLVHSTLIPEC